MRTILSLFVCLLFGSAAFADKPPARISPASMERIQRLVLTLSLQEYPCSQTDLLKELQSLPFLDVGGIGGSDEAFHEKLAITDVQNEVGYYGVNLYLEESTLGRKSSPVVTKAEVFFRPAYSGKFMSMDQLIVRPGHSAKAISFMKEQVRVLNLTPGEYVRLLDEYGMPSDELMQRMDRLSEKVPSTLSK